MINSDCNTRTLFERFYGGKEMMKSEANVQISEEKLIRKAQLKLENNTANLEAS